MHYLPQKEVARRFRITSQLVRDLVQEAKNRPEKLREAKKRVKEAVRKRSAITKAIELMQRDGTTIDNSKRICRLVKEVDDLEVSPKLV